ncbi:MAG: hypothetical protein A2X25_05395 [Chloroflexi bacterium GWB2_49_20]|nr:MAG: hypothetical protein A2X25_05395 [Chloroflexi bacterium GWB2_49_20]OGN77060.1 MAG: hypothetical protein A2X26_06395 [Chloroflexi bacterium GWC2_49_37]OGN83786.1 MAG: hypothetical protein A2X27_01995 [Chloroflexi bacterium GWD2_49_16]HCM96863.1 hypothetical protein [Anaerolineae bacterium]
MTASLVNRLSRLLLEHSARYPHLQVQDVYKLLYQAAMGSGHAVPDAARAQAWLEEEMRSLKADAHQPLVEQISPEARLERRIVRVHLHPTWQPPGTCSLCWGLLCAQPMNLKVQRNSWRILPRWSARSRLKQACNFR